MSYSVCVYCGSRPGALKVYSAQATELGTALAEAGMRLVYGAGDVGLMGMVARASKQAGGTTFGVIPQHLLDREVGKRDLDTFIVTETMHERKKVMVMNADAIVVLPGGAGSLDEFFEVLTWRQLGLHSKPIFLMNSSGYWDKLNDLLNHIVDQGFADHTILDLFETVSDVAELMSALHRARAA